MIKAIGIMKCGISFILFLFCVMTLFNLKLPDKIQWLLAALIICVCFGVYIFYLVNTGIRNITSSSYKLNIIAIIGLLMHFVYMIAIILYSYLNLEIKITITAIIPVAIGIAVGVFDLKAFLTVWNKRKLSKITN